MGNKRQLSIWKDVDDAETRNKLSRYAQLAHAIYAFDDLMDTWDCAGIMERWPKEAKGFTVAINPLLDKMRQEMKRIEKELL